MPRPLKQSDYRAKINPHKSTILSSDVAKLPKPGTGSVPSSLKIKGNWITYLAPSDATSLTRQLYATKITSSTSSSDGKQPNETREVFQPGSSGQESDFSLEEKLRRERLRQMTTGVTSYSWASKTPTMLIPLGGALWILQDPLGDGATKTPPYKLVESGSPGLPSQPVAAPLLDAKISADGSTVAFVCSKEVYVMPTTIGSSPKQVTFGARDSVEGKTNGIADYLAQEEFDRADGFWLSPKGQWLVYENVDESHIPLYRITHQGQENGLATALTANTTQDNMTNSTQVSYEEHRYPFAGCLNPIVTLAVVSTTATEGEAAKPIWFDLTTIFDTSDFYLAKVEWLSPTTTSTGSTSTDDSNNTQDSTKFVVQLLDRRQQKLALLLLDCVTGSITTLHIETAYEGAWINLNNLFRPMPASTKDKDSDTTTKFRFLWGSERDGYRHLYLLESDLSSTNNQGQGEAKVIQRLTGPGEYIVEQIVEVDTDNQCLYYMGTSPDQWLDRHLFRISLKATDEAENETPVCLTASIPGQHSCVMSKKQNILIDTVSNISTPPIVTVYKMPTPTATCLHDDDKMFVLHNAATADERLTTKFVGSTALQPPTFHTFPSTDGAVVLQAAIYKPSVEQYGSGPYPLVVATYGGPHVQYVANSWGLMTADMRTQFLTSNGFAVLKVDNRGSNRRGLLFEKPIRGQMGTLEVEDQVAGVEWAISQNIASQECGIAVSGWSYGGYMALKCLTDRPDIFHAAISGAPVTDWTLYDTAYTERYMGLPQENVDGYQKSSALTKIKDIDGSLLLCHGLLDENVLFRQSAVLINELVAQQKAYDLVLFASERHGPRRPQDRAFMEERLLAFLQRSLGSS